MEIDKCFFIIFREIALQNIRSPLVAHICIGHTSLLYVRSKGANQGKYGHIWMWNPFSFVSSLPSENSCGSSNGRYSSDWAAVLCQAVSSRDHNADTALPLLPWKKQENAYCGDVMLIRFVQTTISPCTSSSFAAVLFLSFIPCIIYIYLQTRIAKTS